MSRLPIVLLTSIVLATPSQAGTTIKSFAPTRSGPLPKAFSSLVFSFPDPKCDFNPTYGISYGGLKTIRTFYAKTRRELPQIVQDQPEASEANFLPPSPAIIATDKRAMLETNKKVGGHIQALPTTQQLAAKTFVFASRVPVPVGTIAQTRYLLGNSGTISLGSWTFFTENYNSNFPYPGNDPNNVAVIHEEGHRIYQLNDVPPNSYTDIPPDPANGEDGIHGDTRGRTIMYSLVQEDAAPNDILVPLYTFDPCDIEVILAHRY